MRGLLGQMLFSGEDALKPTEALSGGEAARLIFCKLMLQKPNFLVLRRADESPGSGSHQRSEYRAAEVRRHGAAGDARSRSDRRSRHAHLALRSRHD